MGSTTEALVNRASEICDKASRENRSMTPYEKQEVRQVLDQCDTIRHKNALMRAITNGNVNDVPVDVLEEYVRAERQRNGLKADIRRGIGGNGMNSGGTRDNALSSAIFSSGFDLKSNPRVEFASASALGRKDLVNANPETWGVRGPDGVHGLPQDQSYLHTLLPQTSIGLETGAYDWTQSGSRTITGTVKRDLDATGGAKATLDVTLSTALVELHWMSIITDNIPLALWEQPGIMQWIDSELMHQIRVATDHEIIASILAASPANESAQLHQIDTIRFAISSMRKNGANPNVLVVGHDTGALLDTELQPTVGGYVFAPRDTGSADPLFGLRIVECGALDEQETMLLDTSVLGMLWLGGMRVDVDPYSGFTTNTVSCRVEWKMAFNVRQILGARQIQSIS